MSALHLVTPPAAMPVSLEEAKAHLRIALDVSDEDDFLDTLISAATDRVELETGRQLLTATREVWLDSTPGVGMGDAPSTGWGPWTGALGASTWMDWGLWWNRRYIDMPFPPLQAVTSIKYTDTNGTVQTWDPTLYQVSAPAGPLARRGRVQPAYGVAWPTLRDQMDALIVQFTCGYGPTGDAVPPMVRRAVLLIVGDLYENREATVVTDRRVTVQPLPYGVDQILQQYRARPVLKAA